MCHTLEGTQEQHAEWSKTCVLLPNQGAQDQAVSRSGTRGRQGFRDSTVGSGQVQAESATNGQAVTKHWNAQQQTYETIWQ